MRTDKIAEIIHANTVIKTVTECYVPIKYKMVDGAGLIDALADHFEAELGNECDAMGCDEEGHRGGHTWTFDRAKFLSKAKGENNGPHRTHPEGDCGNTKVGA